MRLKDKKLLKPRQDNDLLFQVLMSGGSLSDYYDMRDNPLDSTEDIKSPTEDDILASWILGKDEEMNQYKCGGHLHPNGDLLTRNTKGMFDTVDGLYLNTNLFQSYDYLNNIGEQNPVNTETPSESNINQNNFSLFGNIGSALQGFATPAGLIVDSTAVNYLDTGNYGDWKTSIQGTNIDPIHRFIGDIGSVHTDDAIAKLEAERLATDPLFAIGDNASNMQQYYEYIRDRGPKKNLIGLRSWDARIMDNLNASGQGAMLGSAYGPWGALIGGIIGGVANIPSLILEDRNRRKLNNEILKYNIGIDQGYKKFDTNLTNSYKMQLWNQLQQPYACGGKMKHRYDIGGYINSHFDNFNDDLIKIQSGGTHQENPNQGVLVSVAPDGQPNLVEEGETIKEFADGGYVFSDRIVAEEEILKNHLLNNKWSGKTYADISKELDKIVQEHKFDEASQKTFDEMTKRLQEAQEDQKFQEKQKEVEKFIGSLSDEQKEALEEEMVQEAQLEALAEQAIQEQAMQEQAALEALEAQLAPVEQQPIQEEETPIQAQEQPQMSPYDQVMSRALITDAANQGLFGRGGHVAQLGLKMKNRSFDLYPGRNVLDEVVVTAPRMPEPEYFQVPDVDYGILNQPSRPARHIVITPASTTVPSSGNQVVEEEIVIPQTEYSDRLFYNNPYEGIGNYLDNTYTNIPGNGTDSTPAARKPSQRRNSPVKPQPVTTETKPEYSNPHRPDYSMFGQYIPGLVPEEINGNVIGYRDPFGRFVPIGGETTYSTASTNTLTNTGGDTTPTKEGSEPEEKTNPSKSGLSTWLRYAPAIGSGLQALSDALGITNKNDYTNPNMFQRSINVIPNVGFVPIGGYRTPNYLDTLTASNISRSATEAARRAAINNSSGNASAALAALDAMNQQENNALGNLYIQAQQYNNQMEQQVALHNLRINQINASMSMTAQEKNQAIAAEKARLNYNLAQMRQQIENANDMAKSQNYTNLMTNLGNIGRENFIMNQVNSNMGLYYGVDRNGNAYYKSAYNDLSDEEKKVVDNYIKNEGLTIKKK